MGLRSSVMSQAESFETAAKLKPLGNSNNSKTLHKNWRNWFSWFLDSSVWLVFSFDLSYWHLKNPTLRSISRQWRQARRRFLSPRWEFGQLGRRLWPWLDVASQSGCWCISVVVPRHSMRGRSLPWSMIYHDWLLKWLRCQNTKRIFDAQWDSWVFSCLLLRQTFDVLRH